MDSCILMTRLSISKRDFEERSGRLVMRRQVRCVFEYLNISTLERSVPLSMLVREFGHFLWKGGPVHNVEYGHGLL